MQLEATVIPLTTLPTAHPSEESAPATPAAPPAASHASEWSSTAEGDSSGTGSEAASA